MKITEYSWQVNNKKVYGAVFQGSSVPEKVIIFVHGLGEHIRRYDDWFERFVAEGYAVVGADHHGHGRSEGVRGHFIDYIEPMNFVSLLIGKAKELFPKAPLMIYGHSMGGNITLNYLIREKPDVTEAIISSPWVKLVNEPGPLAKWLVSFARKVKPAFTVHSGIKRGQLTSDQEQLSKYDKDEFIHGRISLSAFYQLSKAARYAYKNIALLSVPVLFVHGTHDPISNHKTTMDIATRVKTPVECKIFPGSLHELHHDKNRENVYACISKWLKKDKQNETGVTKNASRIEFIES